MICFARANPNPVPFIRAGFFEAAIGSIDTVELSLRRASGERCGDDASQRAAKPKVKNFFRTHRFDHTATSLRRFLALGAMLALTACGEYDSLRAGPPLDEIDWVAKMDEYSQPGPLGIFFNRRPPPVWIRHSGPYPGPLSEPIAPLIAPDIAEAIVAPPLRPSLTQEGRINLAAASMQAASAATGTAVAWRSPDASGAVTPARDIYRSHRGHICRDLQQRVEKGNRAQAEQITLCREDLGDNRILWLPGSPD